MAPPKKKKKRKGVRIGGIHGGHHGGDGEISGEYDASKDIVKSNEGGGCKSFISSICAAGFDPYVQVKHFPSEEAHETKSVYDVKRHARWTEAENNHMTWTVKREELVDSVLHIVMYDEEVGTDAKVGERFVKVDDHVKVIGDKRNIQLSLQRQSHFSGELTCDIALEGSRNENNFTIHFTIIDGAHLKKQRETDVSTDNSTMFYVFFGFLSWLAIVGAVFYAIEKNDSDKIRNVWDGIWFAFVTATTVGFGDIYPVTPLGRYVNSFVIFVDVVFIGFALGMIVDYIAAKAEKMKDSRTHREEGVQEKLKQFLEKSNKKKNKSKDKDTKPKETEEEQNVHNETELAKLEELKMKQMFVYDLILNSILVVALILGSSAFWYYVEDSWTFATALQFTVVTLSTVGYGDSSPEPNLAGSRIWCAFYIIFGVGLLVRLASLLTDKMIENQQAKVQQKRADESMMHWEQIAEYDIDGEGSLDLYEFCRAVLKATGKAQDWDFEQIENRFNAIDRDNSGVITKEDFLFQKKQKAMEQSGK